MTADQSIDRSGISTCIDSLVETFEHRELLRFLTCGSVDDGKSTLIGRLLHDTKRVYEDQLAELSAHHSGVQGSDLQVDLAWLMDGLKSEREQGITIDVAYRYFSTARRKFVVADTPGHEQYTRNMATGASNSDLAVILIDAQQGMGVQTKRHMYITSLLGITRVVVAVNKMDLIDWSESRFKQICADCREFSKRHACVETYFLPMSALHGDNVVHRSSNLGWFDGPTLMEHLETVDIADDVDLRHFRLVVQNVIRDGQGFRGFAGTVASGIVRPGDTVVAVPSGIGSNVERIVTFNGDLDIAGPGRAVTLTLTDEIDIGRGDWLVSDPTVPLRAHKLDADLVWMNENPLKGGYRCILQSEGGSTNTTVTAIRHRVDINTGDEQPAASVGLNDVARCVIALDKELMFDPYRVNRRTGSFILVDRLNNATVGAGMIVAASSPWDRTPEPTLIGTTSGIEGWERSIRYGQKPCTVLITGLTAAGKSTIATALERELFDRGKVSVRLDGENVRLGISRDLGFSNPERSENLRRIAEVARLVNNQGLIAIAALVAPDAEVRARARALLTPDRFVEVFVDTPIEVCRVRDDKGMYAAAERGEITSFPGVSAVYDRPTEMDLRLDTSVRSPQQCAAAIVDLLAARGFLRG